jgi:hypothetical protein
MPILLSIYLWVIELNNPLEGDNDEESILSLGRIDSFQEIF